jgi:hypothetical protein
MNFPDGLSEALMGHRVHLSVTGLLVLSADGDYFVGGVSFCMT